MAGRIFLKSAGRFLIRLAPLCGIAAMVAALYPITTCAQGVGKQLLRGHVPAAIARQRLQPTGLYSATNHLSLAIGLPLRNQEALNKLLSEIYDPASTNYHRYLTPEQFAAQFGPTEADYAAVMNFARTNGLVVTGTYGNRLLLDVAGPAAAVESAFHVTLRTYRHPTEGRDFFAPDTEPSIDLNVSILHVSGLDNYATAHPAGFKKNSLAVPASGSGPSGSYMGNDFRNAYAPGVILNGAGQKVGLLEMDGYLTSDITNYEHLAGLPNVPLQNVYVEGVSLTPSPDDTEVCLDIEMVVAMATNLSSVVIFEANSGNVAADFDNILNSMAASNQIKQFSSSWGYTGVNTDPNADQAFTNMAVQGQSFFQASGDGDAWVNTIMVPAASPYITSVGGTTLTMNGSGASYASETVWNWGYSPPAWNANGNGYWGSGGGVSSAYSIPSWQMNISTTTNQGSTTMRNIPDVALTASGILVIANNNQQEAGVGGTSCAAPLWAGFTALINQQAAVLGKPSVGFLNPAIYAIGKSPNYAADFHDITTGNNFSASSPANYPAVPGYDLCTGWGTPNGQNLINDLVSPDTLGIAPSSGFNASGWVGGPFSPASQNLLLTNSSASSLTWSLVNTSAWLNASSTGGTLAAGATSSVTVSLAATANSFGIGTYAATVNLTNWNTHVVQSLQFNLQVLQPLAIAPATGFTSIGPVGGPFSITNQNFTLTNAGTIPLNWSLINTSAWLTVTGGGALAAGAAGTATVGLNSAANSLAAGIYAANVWFTNQTSGGAPALQFNLLVGQPLVQNGGFETGTFSSWSLSNDTYSKVTTSITGISHHSGSYFAALGQSLAPGYLSQTLPTVANQLYLLSLWFDNPGRSGNTPNEFSVSWNGNTLIDMVNMPATSGWTNMLFLVTATGGSTVLQFGERDDPWYFGLDDVSVTPVYAPSISTQPTNQTILSGSNVMFTVTAGGTSPLAYQWRNNGTNISNGGNISGAKTNVLTITAATTNNAGNYSVVITNAYGSITSAVATLAVTPVSGPSISTQPANQTIFAGGNAVFNVTAAGTPPLIYQWRKNVANIFDGGVISGATTNLLTFTAAATNYAGNYSVVITNNYGSITSAVATLTVNLQRPVIALASSDNPGGFKDNLNFTAGLTPSGATGSVQFFTNGFYFDSESLVAGSAASVFTAALPRGTNQITAIYSGDANDLPATNSLAQIVTNHPPVAANFITKRFAGLTLDIPVTNLSSNWSDADGDMVSLAAIGVSTNGVTVTNSAGTLIYWNTNDVDDAFVCTVTDGWGGTNFQNVYLTVVPLPNNAIPAISSLVVSGGKTIALNLAGASGFTYVLETSTNLGLPGAWLPLATNVVGTNGVWQFSGAITNSPHRFYRLKLAQ